MSAAENALAIVELVIDAEGKLDVDVVQRRIGLSDEEMTAAVKLLRQAWDDPAIQDIFNHRPAARPIYRPPTEPQPEPQRPRFADRKPSKEIMDFIAYA